jgi:hypothetical protein
VKAAQKEHNSKYGYTSPFINIRKDISISCPIHGEFHEIAGVHLVLKKGCVKCSNV